MQSYDTCPLKNLVILVEGQKKEVEKNNHVATNVVKTPCPPNPEEQQEPDNHVKTCDVEKPVSVPISSCEHCLKTFKSVAELVAHSLTCDMRRYSTISSCEHCLKTFKSVAELVAHSLTCDMRSNRYTTVLPECVSCIQAFQSLEELNIHISRCPKKTHSFVCPDCGDSFWTEHEFKAHFDSYCRKERRERWQ